MSTLPSAIRKEAQRTVAFAITDTIFELGDSAQKGFLHKKIYDAFHGTEANSVSMAMMFLSGKGQFEGLFVSESLKSNATGNDTNSTGSDLTIPSMYSRREDLTMKMGTTITVADLQKATKRKDSNLITGLTLWNMASDSHKSCKKALAIALKYLHRGTELPSGTTLEDFINHILAEMYLQSIAVPQDAGYNDDSDDKSTTAGKERPKDWFFPGFWAFMLFGPLANEDYKSPLFLLGDLTGIHKSRKSTRDKKKVVQDNKRKTSGGDGPNSPFKQRGLSINDRVTVIQVAQQEINAQARKDLLTQESMKAALTSLNAQYNSAIEVAKILGTDCNGTADRDSVEWKDVTQLGKDLTAKRKELQDNILEGQAKPKKPSLAASFVQSVTKNSNMVVSAEDTPVAAKALFDQGSAALRTPIQVRPPETAHDSADTVGTKELFGLDGKLKDS
jgi:hypothetical protein